MSVTRSVEWGVLLGMRKVETVEFGKSVSRFSDLAVAYGVRRWGNAELREMYKKDIDEQIAALGLVVPPADRDRKIF